MSKGLFSRKIKYDNGSVTTFEERFHQRTISLLTCCIPNVQLNDFALDFKGLKPEINWGNGRVSFFLWVLISEGQKKRCFSHTTVSNKNYLEFRFISLSTESLFSSSFFERTLFQHRIFKLFYLELNILNQRTNIINRLINKKSNFIKDLKSTSQWIKRPSKINLKTAKSEKAPCTNALNSWKSGANVGLSLPWIIFSPSPTNLANNSQTLSI